MANLPHKITDERGKVSVDFTEKNGIYTITSSELLNGISDNNSKHKLKVKLDVVDAILSDGKEVDLNKVSNGWNFIPDKNFNGGVVKLQYAVWDGNSNSEINVERFIYVDSQKPADFVSSIKSVMPSTVEKNKNFDFVYTIQNTGGDVVDKKGNVAIYLDGKDDAHKISTEKMWDEFGSTVSGQSVHVKTDKLTTGAHKIWIKADGNAQVTEANEENNWSSLNFTVTAPVVFSVKKGSLYGKGTGINYEKTNEDLVFHFDDFATKGKPSISFLNEAIKGTLNYDIAVTDIKVGVPMKFSLSSGTFDFNYPINPTVSIPSNITKGQKFTVTTSSDIQKVMPTMKVSGLDLSLKAETLIQADVKGDVSVAWKVGNDEGKESLFNNTADKDTLYTAPSIKLFDLGTDYTKKEGALKLNQSGNITQKTEGGRDVYKNPYMEASVNLDLKGFAGDVDGKASKDSKGLYDFSTELKPKSSWVNLRLDIDDSVGSLLSKVPITTVVGQVISKLDGEYRTKDDTYLKYSLISADANLGVSPKMTVGFDVKDIQVTLTPSWDKTHPLTKILGSSFDFVAPKTNLDNANINVGYSLKGAITTKLGLGLEGSVGMKFIGLEGKVLGYEIAGFFPDGADADKEKDSFLSDSVKTSKEVGLVDVQIAKFDVDYQSTPYNLWIA